MDEPYLLFARLRELRDRIDEGKAAVKERNHLLRVAYDTGFYTLESLGKQAGVTKQRLSQIVNR